MLDSGIGKECKKGWLRLKKDYGTGQECKVG